MVTSLARFSYKLWFWFWFKTNPAPALVVVLTLCSMMKALHQVYTVCDVVIAFCCVVVGHASVQLSVDV